MTIADRVRVSEGLKSDLTAERTVVLIHGFNNSVVAAQRSYARFQEQLRGVLGAWAFIGLGKIWEFHWPGDHPKPLVSKASYSVRVPEAKEAGRLLANFLATLQRSQVVWLVAHSLGCRVALHAVMTVRELGAAYDGPRIEHVFLLAAAVPVQFCTAPPYPYAASAEGSAEHAFHSENDEALGWPFNQGQAIYNEPGDAVGLSGRPTGRWTRPPFPTGLKHGAYWDSNVVSREICRRAGLLSEITTPERASAAERTTAPERPLEEWPTGERPVADRSADLGI